jgi:hypothetical protein
MPLYALERSTEEMAFDPPKAKKVRYCISNVVMVVSTDVRPIEAKTLSCSLRIEKIGTFVTLDWVKRKSVRASWATIPDDTVSISTPMYNSLIPLLAYVFAQFFTDFGKDC